MCLGVRRSATALSSSTFARSAVCGSGASGNETTAIAEAGCGVGTEAICPPAEAPKAAIAVKVSRPVKLIRVKCSRRGEWGWKSPGMVNLLIRVLCINNPILRCRADSDPFSSPALSGRSPCSPGSSGRIRESARGPCRRVHGGVWREHRPRASVAEQSFPPAQRPLRR